MAAPSGGPGEAEKAAELAKQAQNPIANLISLPIQNDTTFHVGQQEKRTFKVTSTLSSSSSHEPEAESPGVWAPASSSRRRPRRSWVRAHGVRGGGQQCLLLCLIK
jgi:hypothetical protein